MAVRKADDSGVTSLGKNARTRPSRPTRYFAKFHAGRCPLDREHLFEQDNALSRAGVLLELLDRLLVR